MREVGIHFFREVDETGGNRPWGGDWFEHAEGLLEKGVILETCIVVSSCFLDENFPGKVCGDRVALWDPWGVVMVGNVRGVVLLVCMISLQCMIGSCATGILPVCVAHPMLQGIMTIIRASR